jgi:lipoyl-dependent peroxiredoxin
MVERCEPGRTHERLLRAHRRKRKADSRRVARLNLRVSSRKTTDVTVRDGDAGWRGDVLTVSGKISVGDGVFEGPFSFASRFEDGEGSNPEQLTAAAFAGLIVSIRLTASFTVALSNLLSEAGHPQESLRAHAVVRLRNNDGEVSLSRIDLDTTGRVPGLAETEFQRYGEEARAICPVSSTLAGVPEITLSAKLES